MKRRDFVRVMVGGVAAAYPTVVRAQQSAKPLIGYLSVQATAERPDYIAAFHNAG